MKYLLGKLTSQVRGGQSAIERIQAKSIASAHSYSVYGMSCSGNSGGTSVRPVLAVISMIPSSFFVARIVIIDGMAFRKLLPIEHPLHGCSSALVLPSIAWPYHAKDLRVDGYYSNEDDIRVSIVHITRGNSGVHLYYGGNRYLSRHRRVRIWERIFSHSESLFLFWLFWSDDCNVMQFGGKTHVF